MGYDYHEVYASTTSTGWAIFDDKELKAYGLIKTNGED